MASNDNQINGAGILAYPDFMETAAERMNGSFYILPSSIHEILLLPESAVHSVGELEQMVQGINDTTVEPQDRLSDHVYHYDSKERLFERADRYETRKQEKAQGKDAIRSSVLDTLHGHQKDSMEKPRKAERAHRREEASL